MDALDVSFKVTVRVAPARFESVRAIEPDIPAILNCTRAANFVTHFGTARIDPLLCNRCGAETKNQTEDTKSGKNRFMTAKRCQTKQRNSRQHAHECPRCAFA